MAQGPDKAGGEIARVRERQEQSRIEDESELKNWTFKNFPHAATLSSRGEAAGAVENVFGT